jgi:hypothetical protein
MVISRNKYLLLVKIMITEIDSDIEKTLVTA